MTSGNDELGAKQGIYKATESRAYLMIKTDCVLSEVVVCRCR